MAVDAPNDDVDICNLSLDLLKQRPIVSIDPPDSITEALCARWYPQKRRATLRSHPWNFAIKRIQLTPSSTETPDFGYTHAYILPSDWIRYMGRYEDTGNLSPADSNDYEIENGQYLFDGADATSINLRYIFDKETVADFDALFVDLLVVELAIAMAPKFSGTENRLKVLAEMRIEIQGEARAIDGQERPPRRKQRSKWIQKRRGGFSSNAADKFTRFS